MTKTEQYGLSQWGEDDPVRREDFNADNRKIDRALAAVPYVRLGAVTVQAGDTSVEFDLTGVDLNDYCQLLLTGYGKGSSTSLRINGDASAVYSCSRFWGSNNFENMPGFTNFRLFDFAESTAGGGGRAVLYPLGGSAVGTEIISIGSYIERMYGWYRGGAFTGIRTLQINCGSATTAEFFLYGVKK